MPGITLTVTQVNFFIKSLIEGDGRLQSICVSGEISNFTDNYRSGHLYFSLKDSKSVLKAVMFAAAAKRLKFRPENGMKVTVRGRVSVYEASGQYQLYAESIEPDGVGALSLAFEQLKERLYNEGLFDESLKRPIPAYPERIGVITSPTGAAVRDIQQITERRFPPAELVLCPVQVQGAAAPGQMIKALRTLNGLKACDVIILGRGGGSLEDLWAFNDEELCRAVRASEIPVVSAVGHETDFTICDFVADLRAPTPSAAAELCTPDREELLSRLSGYEAYFFEKAGRIVSSLRQRLDELYAGSLPASPGKITQTRRAALAAVEEDISAAARSRIDRERAALAIYSGRLDALSPLRVLSRGYSAVRDRNGAILRSADGISAGDEISVEFSRGSVKAVVSEVIKEK